MIVQAFNAFYLYSFKLKNMKKFLLILVFACGFSVKYSGYAKQLFSVMANEQHIKYGCCISFHNPKKVNEKKSGNQVKETVYYFDSMVFPVIVF